MMPAFHEISPEQFEHSPFKVIGKDWMLVAASDGEKTNAMTASWGGLGIMWGKNVAFVVIRPQRYTKEFVDSSETFSLSFLNDSYRKTLSYFGTVSGRDEDKIKTSGLVVSYDDKTPYFEAADNVLICKKLYEQKYDPSCFIEKDLTGQWYPQSDYHTMYIAEITKMLTK